MRDHFAELFPEWAVAWSLREAWRANAARFWTEARFHPTEAPGDVLRLADMFPEVSVAPSLRNERPFPKDGANRYGLGEDRYRSTFWGLRPDFVIEAEDASLLLLIEAKGGHVPDGTWRDPKELSYFRFLDECTVPRRKGFSYIVPAKYAEACHNCLAQYFAPSARVPTGFLIWEELLPIIHDKLIETTLDQVIKEMEGLKRLREWQQRAQ